MLYKINLFLTCIIFNGFKNKLRVTLSVIGIFIGVFFFAYTNILIDSFYNAKMQQVEDMPKNVGIIYQYSEFKESDYDLLNSIVTNGPSFGSYFSDYYTIKQKQLENDICLNIKTNIVGVNDYECSAITIEDAELHIVENNLISGRYISNKDNLLENNVMVIDEITAKMLFENKNPIGQKIGFTKLTGAVMDEANSLDVEFEIIGVIESNYYKKYKEDILVNSIIKNEEHEIFYNTTVYIPETVAKELFNGANGYALWNYQSEQEYKKDRAVIKLEEDLSSLSNGSGIFIDRIVEENNIKKEIQNYKTVMISITIIMFVFSGLNNMNIFFFSIKERIHEIGIRKTFGATKSDIIFQFICEGIWIGLISSITAIIVSLVFGKITIDLVWNIWEIKMVLNIGISTMVLPLLIGLLQSVVFAIIPSYYGANILVTESLKFD